MFRQNRSYHCGFCRLFWPLEDLFSRCPVCTTKLEPHRDRPMIHSEVTRRMGEIEEESTFLMIIACGGWTAAEQSRIRNLEKGMKKLT